MNESASKNERIDRCFQSNECCLEREEEVSWTLEQCGKPAIYPCRPLRSTGYIWLEYALSGTLYHPCQHRTFSGVDPARRIEGCV
jgi:hypothetical protein